MSTLDEAALRRPTFTEGYKVALGDGQEWTFPKPVFRLFPKIADDGSIEVAESTPYGRDFQTDLEKMLDYSEDTAEANYKRLLLRIRLAAMLLLKNYALDSEALEALLPFGADVPAAMWDQIDRVLMGMAPTGAAPKP